MSPIPTHDMVRFKRNRFVARFPKFYRYSPAHFWMCEDPEDAGLWRVGLTHFATRMLGEIVEFDVETKAGDAVSPGLVIGWAEGMKAVTDLFCVLSGEMADVNSEALNDPELVCKDPYDRGWLYAVRGAPEDDTLAVEAYMDMLGEKIDAMDEQPWKSAEMAG